MIADGFTFDPTLADALRLQLARIILNSPASEVQDLAQVRSDSLQILALTCPSHARQCRLSVLTASVAHVGDGRYRTSRWEATYRKRTIVGLGRI